MIKLNFIPQKINLNKKGLEIILGSLEAEILKLIWKHSQYQGVAIKELCLYLKNTGNHLSFNTVMTVCHRLVKKGLIIREKGLSYSSYSPTIEKNVFEKKIYNYIQKYLAKNLKNF